MNKIMKTMKFINKIIAVIILCAIMAPSAILISKTTPRYGDWLFNSCVIIQFVVSYMFATEVVIKVYKWFESHIK
jgi:hypothetical protein